LRRPPGAHKLGFMLRRAAAVLAVCSVAGVRAQELPVRTWNVRDGLIQSRVNDVHRDTNGFVWFATWDGVSRFDGVQFTNFGTHEGLPNPLVWCVAEAPDHTLWLGTHGGGLARIADVGQAVIAEPEGDSNPARRVFEIAFDRDGRRLAVAGASAAVSVWDLDWKAWHAAACRIAGRSLSRDEWRRFIGDEPYRSTCD
jgi:ligand-binding sensor domain-containing protein